MGGGGGGGGGVSLHPFGEHFLSHTFTYTLKQVVIVILMIRNPSMLYCFS